MPKSTERKIAKKYGITMAAAKSKFKRCAAGATGADDPYAVCTKSLTSKKKRRRKGM